MLTLYILWLALQVNISVSIQSTLDQNVVNTDVSNAVAAINTLQTWYNENTGLWDTTGWWNSGNALTMLADFSALDSTLDSVTSHVFENTLQQAQQAVVREVKTRTPHSVNTYNTSTSSGGLHVDSAVNFPGFLNDYYDDEGWWALAWLKVYDLTSQTQYLQIATSIFEDMTTGWGTPCGGVWWDKSHSYIGAIENSLFLTVASQLANRMPSQQKPYYLGWAVKEWEWFEQSGMIDSQSNINDGLDLDTCRNNGGIVWSYNQGVILGGLLELNRAAPNDSYLIIAENIAIAAIAHLSDSNGILHEPCEPECGADGPQFKGIFMRNLQLLQQAQPNDKFKDFVNANAESIWRNDRGINDQLDLVWSGPFTSATASTQSSACDALVAAVAVNSIDNAFPANGRTTYH